MAKCPECGEPDAYVGYSSVECRNKKCKHFKLDRRLICSCCGGEGHSYVECPKSLGENLNGGSDDSGSNGNPAEDKIDSWVWNGAGDGI